MRTPILLLVAAALLAAPAADARKYGVTADKPTARLDLRTVQAKGDGAMARNSRFEAYESPGCGAYWKLQNYFLRGAAERTGETVEIEAGVPIGLTATYNEARYAKNRSCAVSGAFVAEPGAHYELRFDVADDVRTCRVTLSRIDVPAPAPVPAEAFVVRPEVCPGWNHGPLESGVGFGIDWVTEPY